MVQEAGKYGGYEGEDIAKSPSKFSIPQSFWPQTWLKMFLNRDANLEASSSSNGKMRTYLFQYLSPEAFSPF